MTGAGPHSYSRELVQKYRHLAAKWPKLNIPRGTAKIAVFLDDIECAVHIGVVVKSGVDDEWIPIPPKIIPRSLGPSGTQKFIKKQPQLLTDSFTITDIPSEWPCGHFNLSPEALDPEVRIPKSLAFERSLGTNEFASTYVAAVSHQASAIYALKRIQRKRDNFQAAQEQMRYFKGELKAMKNLRLRHCVRLVGSYTEANHIGILMHPVADGDLAQYLDEFHDASSKGNPSVLAGFFGCLASTMEALHYRYKIRHKDIKPQNILVKQNIVLFTDFGIALDWADSGQTTTKEETMRSPRYCAPEAANDQERNTKTDIWSLGCVFLEMITVLKGFDRDFVSKTMSPNDKFHQNTQGVANVISALRKDQSKCGNAPLEWIEKMLQHDKVRRPNSRELVEMIVATGSDRRLVFRGPCCSDYGYDDSDEDGDLATYQEATPGTPSEDYSAAQQHASPTPLRPPAGTVAVPSAPPPLSVLSSIWTCTARDVPGETTWHQVKVYTNRGVPDNWISPGLARRLRLQAKSADRYLALNHEGMQFRSNEVVVVSWKGKSEDRLERSDFVVANGHHGTPPFELLVGDGFISSFGRFVFSNRSDNE